MSLAVLQTTSLWPAGFCDATCVAIRAETPTIRTFVFAPDDPSLLDFSAGQSVALAVAIAGECLVRTFSISSAPGRERLELTVKVHPGGVVTRWLHDRLAVGTRVGLSRPRGRFTLEGARSDKLAFLSAGSGATPLMAMLRALDAKGEAIDAAWFHVASATDELLFADELAGLQARHPGLSVSMAVSRPLPGWFGYRGRTTRRQLASAIPDLGRRDVFACGPAGFMDTVRLIHAAEGGERESFHCESFGGAPRPTPTTLLLDDPEAGEVRTHDLAIGARTVPVKEGETILQAALRAGIVIPCGCGQGVCGTCRVKKVEGDFVMQHQGGLSPEEEREGYLLACSSRINGPSEIQI